MKKFDFNKKFEMFNFEQMLPNQNENNISKCIKDIKKISLNYSKKDLLNYFSLMSILEGNERLCPIDLKKL